MNLRSRVFNLILLGDPAVGKATQAKKLLKKYKFLREFDFGKWLRNLTSEEKRKYRYSETAGKGFLTPTKLARAKFKEVIFSTPKNRGMFFNGNPKMLGEAKLIKSWMQKSERLNILFIYLSIPKKEMLKRIEIRAKEEGRSDDEVKYIENRMKYYSKNIRDVARYLSKNFKSKKISGLGTREEVYRRLTAWINANI